MQEKEILYKEGWGFWNWLTLIIFISIVSIFLFSDTTKAYASTINFTTDYFGGTQAAYVIGDTDLSDTACNSQSSPPYNHGVPACIDVSQTSFSSPVYALVVYDASGGNPILTSYNASWQGLLSDGDYYALITYNGVSGPDCSALAIAACVAAYVSAGFYQTTIEFTISSSGTVMAEFGGGGGGAVYGCTDPSATNYDPMADTDDASCTYDDTATSTSSVTLVTAVNNLTFGLACIFFILCLFAFAYFTPGYTKKS
jgi:hypothetical protein